MAATIKEIASLLRSTEEMATQFVQRVQSRVGQPVHETEILAAMKKISARSLSMEKVVAKVQQQRKPAAHRTSKQRTSQPQTSAPSSPQPSTTATSDRPRSSATRGRAPQTIMEQLEAVLVENWERAEAEGLEPNRMSTRDFVEAIYQFTDRREGTRRRILQAAKQLDEADIVLTPALVADVVHELFQS